MKFIRQGATHKVVVGPAVAVANGYVPVTNLTLSGADEAEVILHDNGTVVDISAYTFAAITTADGYYHLTLQSGISNTVGHMTVVINDDSLILPLREDFTIVEEAVYDALFAASANAWTGAAGSSKVAATIAAGDIANSAITAASIATDAITDAKIASDVTVSSVIGTGGITAASFAAGAIDAAAIAANAIGASELAADAVAEIADAVWDEAIAGHLAAGSTGEALSDAGGAGTPPTVGEIADAVWDEATAGHTTSGTFGEQVKTDIDDILTDTAEIGAAGAGLTNINLPDQTMNVTGNITSNLSGSVGSVTGAVGSVTGTVGSVAGNVTGSVGSLATQAKADVNAEVLDVLNTDTFAEPGQGTPAATTSLVAKIGYLYKHWRNKKTETSSTWSLFNDDAVTVDQKATVSDDATTATKGEIATGP